MVTKHLFQWFGLITNSMLIKNAFHPHNSPSKILIFFESMTIFHLTTGIMVACYTLKKKKRSNMHLGLFGKKENK